MNDQRQARTPVHLPALTAVARTRGPGGGGNRSVAGDRWPAGFAQAKPASRSATCTRRPSTARSGPASTTVTSASKGLELETGPVHHRPRTVPGDDRRQPRHAGDRRRDLEFPGARSGQGVPDQQRRVRHRAALGARGQGVKDFRRPQGQARSRPRPAPRPTCSSTTRCARTASTRARTSRSSTSGWPRP